MRPQAEVDPATADKVTAALAPCDKNLQLIIRGVAGKSSSFDDLSLIVHALGHLHDAGLLPQPRQTLPRATKALSSAIKYVLEKVEVESAAHIESGKNRSGRAIFRSLSPATIVTMLDAEAVRVVEDDEARNGIRQELAFWAKCWCQSHAIVKKMKLATDMQFLLFRRRQGE